MSLLMVAAHPGGGRTAVIGPGYRLRRVAVEDTSDVALAAAASNTTIGRSLSMQKRDGGGVHHLEALVEDVEVGDLVELAWRSGSSLGSAV